jgi:hypothetical protein
LGDWAVAGGGEGGWLVAADLLIFIRMMIFLPTDFCCATKIFFYTPKKNNPYVHLMNTMSSYIYCYNIPLGFALCV